jgi:short-subunit dehydrogenase
MNILNPTTESTPRVLITGATGGLGKAFAVECASRGWNLFLTDLRAGALETLSTSLQTTYGVDTRWAACDLTESSARDELFEQLHSHNLRFCMLVNVAGLDFEGEFTRRTRAELRTLLRLNIEATVEMMHVMLELRNPSAALRILNVGSLAAFYPMPVKAAYAASKRFLLDLSLALREELREIGATVTVLCPAGMPTTRECIEAIEAQGLLGHITTRDTGPVAAAALDAALRGQAVYIPGAINRLARLLGGLLPAPWIAGLIAARWRSAWERKPAALRTAGLAGQA